MILLDGPMGTLLEHRGLDLPAPLWTAAAVRDHPARVQEVHSAYAHAGATVHTAATFRTSRTAAGTEADALTRLALELARASVPHTHRVAGALAPCFDCWQPDLSPTDAERRHRHTATTLAEAHADLLLIETFANPAEALSAARAALDTGLETWAALTPGMDGRLMSPLTLAQTALQLARLGVRFVLINCVPARRAAPWVQALAATGVPWGIYANAGTAHDGLGHGQEGAARAYADLAETWVSAGAQVLGGCCMTGPEHISELSRRSSQG